MRHNQAKGMQTRPSDSGITTHANNVAHRITRNRIWFFTKFDMWHLDGMLLCPSSLSSRLCARNCSSARAGWRVVAGMGGFSGITLACSMHETLSVTVPATSHTDCQAVEQKSKRGNVGLLFHQLFIAYK